MTADVRVVCRCGGIHFKKEEPMKFVSWNINGANSVFNGGELDSTLKLFGADILAFQETKVFRRDRRIVLPGWHDFSPLFNNELLSFKNWGQGSYLI